MPNIRRRAIGIASFVGLLIAICFIHYGIERSSMWLLPAYGLAFVNYVIFYKKSVLDFRSLMILALVARIVLFMAPPSLSDDYHRFLWDGQVWVEGINPYQYTPQELDENKAFQNDVLYPKLNSVQYHTTYPPLSQYIFSLPAWFGIQSGFMGMTMIRFVLLLFEIGCVIILYLLTRQTAKVALYAFNPLVLLELTGNLHFEGVVIVFLLLAIWSFNNQQWMSGATAMALGILAKLTPLMLLPLWLKKLGLKNAVLGYLVLVITLVVLSIPLLNFEVLSGMLTGLDLFFRKFEFNAGLFFLFREIGYWIKGYDMVQTLGPMMSYVAFGAIMVYSIFMVKKETDWASAFTIIISIQLLLATTVHPWYVIPLLAFSCMTGYVFPVVWSLMAFLSYFGYSADGYDHPMFLIFLEYVLVCLVGFFELIKRRPLLHEF